jgi:predicted amidophosphoribosyltransferase
MPASSWQTGLAICEDCHWPYPAGHQCGHCGSDPPALERVVCRRCGRKFHRARSGAVEPTPPRCRDGGRCEC